MQAGEYWIKSTARREGGREGLSKICCTKKTEATRVVGNTVSVFLSAGTEIQGNMIFLIRIKPKHRPI